MVDVCAHNSADANKAGPKEGLIGNVILTQYSWPIAP
jgi:hypothetical protein